MSWRERFGMQAAPLPRGAAGETFFDKDPHYQRLARAFAWLAAEPGIGVLTGEQPHVANRAAADLLAVISATTARGEPVNLAGDRAPRACLARARR